MDDRRYTFRTKLWVYQGPAAWYFVTLPQDISGEIKVLTFGARRGWGSVRVTARLGETVWNTSLFYSAKAGAYMLPVKASVRQAERIGVGDEVDVSLDLGG